MIFIFEGRPSKWNSESLGGHQSMIPTQLGQWSKAPQRCDIASASPTVLGITRATMTVLGASRAATNDSWVGLCGARN